MQGAGFGNDASLHPRILQTRHSFVLDLVWDANTVCKGFRVPSESPTPASSPLNKERWINVAKRSSVSTGKLNVLLRLHIRPIDLVVFQGTFGQLPNET